MSEPTGPCAVYTRGVAYSDEVFFVDSDPMLEAALRAWRSSGNPNEVLSLLQHQNENSEAADLAVSIHASFPEAEVALPGALVAMISDLTFVDFGFGAFGIGTPGSRWYSTQDDDDAWTELFDEMDIKNEEGADVARLLAWCDKHQWPHPTVTNRAQLEAISARSMETVWDDLIDDDPESFLADIVAEQLRGAKREDLLIDLWSTLVGSLVFIGPAPSEEVVPFDLRTMSLFKERNIDTSAFSATSLARSAPTTVDPSSKPTRARDISSSNPTTRDTDAPARKGLFSRIFGK
jgi:hypothetical protein